MVVKLLNSGLVVFKINNSSVVFIFCYIKNKIFWYFFYIINIIMV